MDRRTVFVTLCVCMTILAASGMLSRATARPGAQGLTPEQIAAWNELVATIRMGGCPCPGDSNCDGMVDFTDITVVLANWGATCCPTGMSCDDGNVCTQGDTCIAGVCVGVPISGCTTCLSAVDCDDNDPCTTDLCQGGVCQHIPIVGCSACLTHSQCDDGNPCTSNLCVAGVCQFPVAPNGTACGTSGVCINGICTNMDELPPEWQDWIRFQNDMIEPNE